MIFAVLDGSTRYDWGNSLVACLVSIVLVFLVLIAIILITEGVFFIARKFPEKKEKETKKPTTSAKTTSKPAQFNENDEDMVAAVMVATIDYQNEIKEDVKLVSVKEIK